MYDSDSAPNEAVAAAGPSAAARRVDESLPGGRWPHLGPGRLDQVPGRGRPAPGRGPHGRSRGVTAPLAAGAPADLRLQRLRKRVGQLRELLAEALHLIGEVYESDDWKLVADSWEDFCADQLPE